MVLNNNGYTIIEVLIVIVIIGILAVVSYPNLIGLTDSSRKDVIATNMRSLLSEIEIYAAQNDSYPEIDTDGFIENDEDWNSLANIIEEIGDEETLYNYEQNDEDFVFSIKLSEDEFIGISKSNSLQTDLENHLEL